MWFRLQLCPFRKPLAAVVAFDGTLYWRIVDVGSFLGRKDPYSFSRRFGSGIHGRDVLPDHVAISALNSHLITTDQVVGLLQRFDIEMYYRFTDAVMNGTCAVSVPQQRFTCYYKQSPLLLVDEAGTEYICSWINQFVADALTLNTVPVMTSQENSMATREDSMAPQEDSMAPQEDSMAPQEDSMAPQKDTMAPQEDSRAPQEDSRASKTRYLTPEVTITPLYIHKDVKQECPRVVPENSMNVCMKNNSSVQVVLDNVVGRWALRVNDRQPQILSAAQGKTLTLTLENVS